MQQNPDQKRRKRRMISCAEFGADHRTQHIASLQAYNFLFTIRDGFIPFRSSLVRREAKDNADHGLHRYGFPFDDKRLVLPLFHGFYSSWD